MFLLQKVLCRTKFMYPYHLLFFGSFVYWAIRASTSFQKRPSTKIPSLVNLQSKQKSSDAKAVQPTHVYMSQCQCVSMHKGCGLEWGKREKYHSVTLLVKCTGSLAEIDFGSALAMVSVYMSENLGNLEETIKPVLVKDPCKKKK